MRNREKIAEFMKGKDKVNLKDIYSAFPDIKKEVIRGTINAEIKKELTFERISKCFYKLK